MFKLKLYFTLNYKNVSLLLPSHNLHHIINVQFSRYIREQVRVCGSLRFRSATSSAFPFTSLFFKFMGCCQPVDLITESMDYTRSHALARVIILSCSLNETFFSEDFSQRTSFLKWWAKVDSMLCGLYSLRSCNTRCHRSLCHFPFRKWWAKVDSNHRPHDYQSCALAS